MRSGIKTSLMVVGAFVGGISVGYSKAREFLFESIVKAALH